MYYLFHICMNVYTCDPVTPKQFWYLKDIFRFFIIEHDYYFIIFLKCTYIVLERNNNAIFL